VIRAWGSVRAGTVNAVGRNGGNSQQSVLVGTGRRLSAAGLYAQPCTIGNADDQVFGVFISLGSPALSVNLERRRWPGNRTARDDVELRMNFLDAKLSISVTVIPRFSSSANYRRNRRSQSGVGVLSVLGCCCRKACVVGVEIEVGYL